MAEAALPKTYDPAGTEARWQGAWEEAGAFHPDPSAPGDPFSVVIPPPNVTGSLHMGHGFETALIDTIVRFQRLQGKNVLCLPGTDHASIAVQSILERQIKAEGGSKDDLGRDAFLERAWSWKAASGGTIVGQLRRLGYSVDWKRERFTLDPGLNKAVVEAFVRLHEQGLIYRGEYLVNWCPASGSAVSDLEVEMKELDGHLWHFRYPLSGGAAADGTDHLVVATTRPETLLGDTGVAVHPTDPRYAALVGQTITLPLVGREIPIVADEHVDPAFGTGCVKVTPAHDPNDFAIGSRHGLPLITVMAKDGSMNAASGRFAGLDRFEARKAVVAAMEAEGFLVKVEPHRHSVPFSDRGKVPVEPLLSTQWFARAEPLAARCREALDRGEPRFVPQRWEKVYRDWLTDIRDWCISRQLWWGHRIPAWFVVSETGGVISDATPYVVARDGAEAQAKAEAQYGEASRAAGRELQLEQDPDVLDTWFSSGLWPFSTLGWPDETSADLATWYPTSVLVTGFDIIFFWVARMTMLSGAFLQEGEVPVGGRDTWIPFRDVMIHGLVRDENNRKMSKSAGNGIDPLPLIERYGADALRFALVREVAGAGQDIRLDYDRTDGSSATVEAARNFANKLWNATRFALMNLGGETPASLGEPDPESLTLADRWILSRLARVNRETAERYGSYGLGEAAKGLYEFAWNEVCDWTIELLKRRLNPRPASEGDTPGETLSPEALADQRVARQVLAKVLAELLVLLHPLMPHLSEELWHGLTGAQEETFLALQAWPALNEAALDDALEARFSELIEAIRVVRNLRAVAGLKPSQSAPVVFLTSRPELAAVLREATGDITALTRAASVEVRDPGASAAPASERCLAAVSGELQVLLPIEGLVDLDALRGRLEKDLAKAEKEIKGLAGRLANPNFAGKAPPEVVAECRVNLAEAEAQAALAQGRLKGLG
ncbi:valine--tRNA ligase [Synechococcus sp. BA-124 BA4]|uniref:valine--tRNA ligase n=1 Tax=unclassified Synechococcus TaxID=2626047 RepID=UPI0018CDA876|nr:MULTISPECIES: valine--tRNA ligase [unclassified Synechococcus]MEA5400710.1 valine--tRNA ligase [Synechococcus sp. BA-124 BA4]QPN57788.1 valine--tRNA ligase [Synechococcus sp. CBW1107]CAK6687320.1 Valine--tRNA ligase [Synechococcus sp. CBW1107]